MALSTLKLKKVSGAYLSTARRRASTVTRYQSTQLTQLESVSEQFISGAYADDQAFSDDFRSFADGVRFINDLNKAQHLAVMKAVLQEEYKVESAFYAVDNDISRCSFVLLLGSSGAYPVPVVLRFSVNEAGQVNNLWSRRGVFVGERDLLRRPGPVFARMEAAPAFDVTALNPDRARPSRMLAVLDDFLLALNTESDAERLAAVEGFTTEDFLKWESTSVWEPMLGGVQVIGRDGLAASMGVLMRLGGKSGPGQTRVVVRGKAASATHNLAFMHLDYMAVSKDGPVALDVFLVFAFTNSGAHIRRAMGFRSAIGLPEYALTFKMDADISLLRVHAE